MKILYFTSIIVSWSFFSNSLYLKYPNLFKNESVKTHQEAELISTLSLNIGKNIATNEDVIIPEKGLYQNILITGTIGTRKNIFCYVPFP